MSSRLLDEGSHVLTVAAELEEELPNVRLRLHEDEKNGLDRQDRDDDEPVRVLEDAGDELAALADRAELVRGRDDRGNVRGEPLGIEIRNGLPVDEKPVASEDDRRFDAVALPDSGDQLADRRHAGS